MSQTPQDTNSGADPDAPQSAAAKLFDIRLLIGGLFLVYGVLLTISGFFTSDKERAKAADININLWLGIGMLILGAIFLLWRHLNPQHVTRPTEADADAESTGAKGTADGH